MLHESIAKFSICQCICAEVAAICIFWICAWALTRQRRICTAVLLFDIWSKYDNFTYLMTYFGGVNKFAQHVYFLANLQYANELLKHMSRGFSCTCPPCCKNSSLGLCPKGVICINIILKIQFSIWMHPRTVEPTTRRIHYESRQLPRPKRVI